MPFRIRTLLASTILFVFAQFSAYAADIPALPSSPLGERWYSVNMGTERVGFVHLKIGTTSSGYEIHSEGSTKLLVMGIAREASSRESYQVNKDLSLKSFVVEEIIDGSRLNLRGEVTTKGIRITTESAGSKTEKTLKTKGAVYPSQALNIFPLMRGAKAGQTYRLHMLDVEAIKVKEVEISVIGPETLPGEVAAVHLRNDLYPFVDNDIWVDTHGNTIKESIRDDLILTLTEDEKTARQFLTEAAIGRKDLVLDYSLVKVVPPLEQISALKKLVVELSGFPPAFPLLQGPGQHAARLADDKVQFTLERPAIPRKDIPIASDNTAFSSLLETSQRILPDNPAIRAKLAEIVGTEQSPTKIVEKLTRWVATEIKGAVTDSQSPLETMESGRGNCQSHARLYASLARAAGIPTRFVSGLVYSSGQGFLYHSWAESFTGEWLAVDPTFGQQPVDTTHIKLVEGDSPDEMSLLAAVIGKVKAKVVEKNY